jgi:hypothetical protein
MAGWRALFSISVVMVEGRFSGFVVVVVVVVDGLGGGVSVEAFTFLSNDPKAGLLLILRGEQLCYANSTRD